MGVGIGDVDLDPTTCGPSPKVCPPCPFLNPSDTSIPHPPSSLACINAINGSTPSSIVANSRRRTRRPVMRFFPNPGSSRALLTNPFPVHTSPPPELLISGLASRGDEAADRRRWGGWTLTRDLLKYVSRGSKVYSDRSVAELVGEGRYSGLRRSVSVRTKLFSRPSEGREAYLDNITP